MVKKCSIKNCLTNQALWNIIKAVLMKKIMVKIKYQRIRAGLTQAELAALMGVSRTTVVLVETGKQFASPRFRKKALRALKKTFSDITLDDIF